MEMGTCSFQLSPAVTPVPLAFDITVLTFHDLYVWHKEARHFPVAGNGERSTVCVHTCTFRESF